MSYKILFFLPLIGCSLSTLYDCEKSFEVHNIDVDVIAERDGQKLRGFILNSLRDLNFTNKGYRLTVNLAYKEIPFAFNSRGSATRLKLLYTASVVLKDKSRNIVFQKSISVFSSNNISNTQGEVVFSLYACNNVPLLKELSHRIMESIKVFLSHES